MKIENISAYSRDGDTLIAVSLKVAGDAETALATIFDLVRSASVSRDTVEKVELPRLIEKTSVVEFVKARDDEVPGYVHVGNPEDAGDTDGVPNSGWVEASQVYGSIATGLTQAVEIAKAETAPEAPTPATRRRRASAATEPSKDADTSTELPTDEKGNIVRGTPARRRYRAASEGQSEAHPPAPAAKESLRSGKSEAPAGATTGSSPDATASAAPTTAQPTASADISDADLLKAASQAAMKITPKGVMEFLATFGVKQVNDLKGEQRRQFIDGLKTRTAG